jgi:hypothetical protein
MPSANVLILRSSRGNFPEDISDMLSKAGISAISVDGLDAFISCPARREPFLLIIEIGSKFDLDRALLAHEWAETVQPFAPSHYLLLQGDRQMKMEEAHRRFSATDLVPLPFTPKSLRFKVDLHLKLLAGKKQARIPAQGFTANVEHVTRLAKRVLVLRGQSPSDGKWIEDGSLPEGAIRWRWVRLASPRPKEEEAKDLRWEVDSAKEPEYVTEAKGWLLESVNDNLRCLRGDELIFSYQKRLEPEGGGLADREEAFAPVPGGDEAPEVVGGFERINIAPGQAFQGEEIGPKGAGKEENHPPGNRETPPGVVPGPLVAEPGPGENTRFLESLGLPSAKKKHQPLGKAAGPEKSGGEEIAEPRSENSKFISALGLPPVRKGKGEKEGLPEGAGRRKNEPRQEAGRASSAQEERFSAGKTAGGKVKRRIPDSRPGEAKPAGAARPPATDQLPESRAEEDEEEDSGGRSEPVSSFENAAKRPAQGPAPWNLEGQDQEDMGAKPPSGIDYRDSVSEGRLGEGGAEEILMLDDSPGPSGLTVEKSQAPGREENVPPKVFESSGSHGKRPSGEGDLPKSASFGGGQSTAAFEQDSTPQAGGAAFSSGAGKEERGKKDAKVAQKAPANEFTANDSTSKIAAKDSEATKEKGEKPGAKPEKPNADEKIQDRLTRVSYNFTLAQLSDRDSSWHFAEKYRVYLSAVHGYGGLRDPREALPIWVYLGELDPEFLERDKAWRFYDRQPELFRTLVALPDEVAVFLYKLAKIRVPPELEKRIANKLSNATPGENTRFIQSLGLPPLPKGLKKNRGK